MYWIAYVCILFGVLLMAFAAIYILRKGVTAFGLSLLGFGLFTFVDAGKYYFVERDTRGDFGDQTFLFAVLSSMAALVLFLISYRYSFERWTPWRGRTETLRTSNTNHGYFVVMFALLGINAYSLLNENSNPYMIMFNVMTLGYIIFGAGSFLLQKKWTLMLICVLIAFSVLVLTDFTSRRVIIACVVPFFAFFLLSNSNKKRGSTFKTISVIGFALLIFVYLNFMRSEHDFGRDYVSGGKWQNTVDYIVTLRSIDTFWNTLFSFQQIGSRFEHYWGSTYLAIPVALIPREYWDEKPVGFSVHLALMQRFDYQGRFNSTLWENTNLLSLSPGLLGEAYANFSYAGIILIPLFLGAFCKILDRLTYGGGLTAFVMFSPLLSISLLLHRGDAYVAFIFPFFLFIGGMVAWRFLGSVLSLPSSKQPARAPE